MREQAVTTDKTNPAGPTGQRPGSGRHRVVALACVAFVAGMVGMSYAAVPLYQLFCQVTGYGGTTQRADAPSDTVSDRVVTVRFDANVGAGLSWTFNPVERTVTVNAGQITEAAYRVTSRSGNTSFGTATFNVTPHAAGAYFNKIDCFCFTEQKLEAGETVDMPVVFFVDPAIDDDPDLASVETITLSYTFFETEPAEPRETASAPGTADAVN